MAQESKVEKFSRHELANLRNDLLECRSDTWQAADVVSAFLAGRGYGIDSATMRDASVKLDAFVGPAEAIQAALEAVAFVM